MVQQTKCVVQQRGKEQNKKDPEQDYSVLFDVQARADIGQLADQICWQISTIDVHRRGELLIMDEMRLHHIMCYEEDNH